MDRLEVIETLKHMPDRVEELMTGLADPALRAWPSEGEWSIIEVVGHLRDYAQVWQKRLYMVWSLTDPFLPDYDQVASVREHNYQEADLKALLHDMRAYRAQTVELLSQAIDWTRLGQLEGVGRRSLMQFAVRIIDHEVRHLSELRERVAASRAAANPG
jgi:hypothetical protein